LISKYLNRPISTRISIILYRSGFTIEPLIVTLVSLVFGLSAGLLLAMREFIFGGLLVQLVSVMDGVDGELTKLYRRTTSWEAYVDSVLDRISDIAIVAGLALSWPTIDSFILLFAILATANVILLGHVTHNLDSLGGRTEKLRNMPVTRDARLFIIFVTSVLSLPLYGLYYLAIAPIFYLGYLMVLALKFGRAESKPERIVREPKPEVLIEKKEISNKIESLVSNTVKLGLALLLLNMIAPAISSITLIDFDGLTLSSDHLLSALTLIITIYFGYRIMLALKTIIDIITKRLVVVVGVTEPTLKHILVDSLYIVSAAVLWGYLPPQLTPFPYIGEYLSRLATLVIFVFLLLILYDLAKLLYRTFGDFYRKTVEKIAEKLHEGAESP